jgi:SRSO17 transposase
VRAAHGFHEGRAPGKELWLLVEWPEQSCEPSKYFLCDLPATSSLRRLVQVTKSRWPIEQNYQQLKEQLGLEHYEGRSWNGWHHHVTLVMLAHAFLTLETLRNKKNWWLDPAEDAPWNSAAALYLDRFLLLLRGHGPCTVIT